MLGGSGEGLNSQGGSSANQNQGDHSPPDGRAFAPSLVVAPVSFLAAGFWIISVPASHTANEQGTIGVTQFVVH